MAQQSLLLIIIMLLNQSSHISQSCTKCTCEMTFLSYFLQCFCCVLATDFVSDGPLVSVWYPPCTCQHETKETLCRWWLHARGHTVCVDWVGGTGERIPSNIDTTLVQYGLHAPHVKRNMKMASNRWADRHVISKHHIAPHLINRNVYCKPTCIVDLSPQQPETIWTYITTAGNQAPIFLPMEGDFTDSDILTEL